MTFITDMYQLASMGDYDSFMTGVVIVSLYAILIGFSALDFVNKRR